MIRGAGAFSVDRVIATASPTAQAEPRALMSARTPMEAPRLWLVLARCHRALSQIAERSIEETGLGLTDFAAPRSAAA